MPIDDLPAFSRSPSTHPLGKLTFQTKVDLPEVVGEVLIARARELGMTTAELHREVLSWWACRDLMQSVLDQRAQVAMGNQVGIVPEKP